MTVGAVSEAIPHAEKKATRLRERAAFFQFQIDEVNTRHANAIAAVNKNLHQLIDQEREASRELEVVQRQITTVDNTIAELHAELQTLEQTRHKHYANLERRLANKAAASRNLAAEQVHAEVVRAPSRRHIAVLQKKKDAVERRLALHLARVPLNALVPK